MRFSIVLAVFAAVVSASPRAQGAPDLASILEGLKSGGGGKGFGGAGGAFFNALFSRHYLDILINYFLFYSLF